jgi:hypothetical protein
MDTTADRDTEAITFAEAARLAPAFGALPLVRRPPTRDTIRHWAIDGLPAGPAGRLHLLWEYGPGGGRYTTRRHLRAFVAQVLAGRKGAA